MNPLSIILCAVAVIGSVTATNYCSSNVCNSGVTHVACGHSGNFDVTCPADAKMVAITRALKQLLIDAHNEKRNFIAGGGDAKHSSACRMSTMQWDDELASIAALNVRKCKMGHDKCHNTDAFKFSGQNLAWMGFYGVVNDVDRLKQSVQMWFDEVKDSKQAYIDSYPNGYNGPTIGHFTVMMADRNVRVGCAASHYTPPGASYRAYLVACNYATNNMINFPIYSRCDKAATSCTTGRNAYYTNLCSPSEAYTVNKWY